MLRTEVRRGGEDDNIHTRIYYLPESIETGKTIFIGYFNSVLRQPFTTCSNSVSEDVTQS